MTLFLTSLLVACSGEAPPEKPAAPEPTEQAKKDDHGHEGHDAAAAETMKPSEGAKVMFTSPAEGASVPSPVKVVMAVEGMEVKPAGELVEGTGHHHILVDTEPVPFGTAVPADDQHIHFGKGQTETELELEPGEHTLTLQFADGVHRSYGEQMTATVKITVTE
ncbi:MAG: DUF4399 domain-containing protein [Myxococcota bacterium]